MILLSGYKKHLCSIVYQIYIDAIFLFFTCTQMIVFKIWILNQEEVGAVVSKLHFQREPSFKLWRRKLVGGSLSCNNARGYRYLKKKKERKKGCILVESNGVC